MNKHTPGEWTINANKIDGDGYHLASINSHATTIGRANAQLIAASPTLLEALKSIMESCDSGQTSLLVQLRIKARAAIDKAEGKS
jgi:hypothetical protein